MTANIYAIATLCTALATLITSIGSTWIGIVGRGRLSDKVQAVHNKTADLHDDIDSVKKDVFSMTSVLTQRVMK